MTKRDQTSRAELRSHLGTAVHARRTQLGLSQRELAERAGVGKATISKIEKSKLSPTIETLARLSIGLELQLAELVQTVGPRADTMRPEYTVQSGAWTTMRRELLTQVLDDVGDLESTAAVLGVPAEVLAAWLEIPLTPSGSKS